MNLFIVIAVLAGSAAASLIIVWLISSFNERRRVISSLGQGLLLIQMPHIQKQAEGFLKPETAVNQTFRESLKQQEQFFSTLTALKEPVTFEMAVSHTGEEISFYVGIKRNKLEYLKKVINGFWPDAAVYEVEDYNIFNPRGSAAAAYLKFQNSFILPITSYDALGYDPLEPVAAAMSKLVKVGEGAAMQMIIKPAPKSYGKKIFSALKELRRGASLEEALKANAFDIAKFIRPPSRPKTHEEKERQMEEKSKKIPDEELIKLVSMKVGKSLFAANIRFVASANDKGRAEDILDELMNILSQYARPRTNSFRVHKLTAKKAINLIFDYSFRIFRSKQEIILNYEELTSLWHFPVPGSAMPKVKWLKARVAEPPVNLPSEGVILGETIWRGEKRQVRILKDDRRRHIYFIGQTGTGKSALMLNLIRQDIMNGEGVCLLDPHGDLAETILGYIPSNRLEETVYFNPGDISRPIGFNMLEYDPKFPEQKTFIINELIEIVDKLYNLRETGGPMFEQYLRNALLLLMDDVSELATIMDLPRVLADKDFRDYKLSREENILVSEFWRKEAEKAGGEQSLANMVPYITSKFNPFISNDFIRPIVGQLRSAFSFRDIIDNRKILIINLSKGQLGDINAYLLGMLIVGKLFVAALSRVDIPEETRNDFYVYLDEFQNVSTNTINSIFSEARKYRLSLTVAHQFIAQLQEKIRDSVFGNVGTIGSFRVGPQDAEFLEKEFAPVFSENDLVNIDNFNVYIKLLINGQTSRAFNFKTFPPAPADFAKSKLVKEFSSLKYGRPREEVEAEIRARRLSRDFEKSENEA